MTQRQSAITAAVKLTASKLLAAHAPSLPKKKTILIHAF